jgi:hypothetical protein
MELIFFAENYFHGASSQAFAAASSTIAMEVISLTSSSLTGGPTRQPELGPVDARPRKPLTFESQKMQQRARFK